MSPQNPNPAEEEEICIAAPAKRPKTKRPRPRPLSKQHRALKGSPKIPLTSEEWENINIAIQLTTEYIVAEGLAYDMGNRKGFTPLFHMDLGVALQAETRRHHRVKRGFDTRGENPTLRRMLLKMARDPTTPTFRYDYVWFSFKMMNLDVATISLAEKRKILEKEAEATICDVRKKSRCSSDGHPQ